MSITQNDALKFHCPRWNELPAISLYMDQVMIVLEDALSLFAGKGEKIITPAMINNYVRLKLVTPPERKKYGREQLALLMMVCVLKNVLSISEITWLLTILTRDSTLEAAYDSFCGGLERMFRLTFSSPNGTDEEISKLLSDHRQATFAGEALDAALMALMGKMLVQNYTSEEAERAALKSAKPTHKDAKLTKDEARKGQKEAE